MLWPLFPPAVRSGGPTRSAAGMLAALAEEFQIFVITSAYDMSPQPMNDVRPDQWCDALGASVWYVSQRRPHPLRLLHLIRSCDPHLVYLNSLWHVRYSLLPLLALRAARESVPVLIAPRGELSAGALRIRSRRKRLLIVLYRALGISRGVTWHAATEMEREDIFRAFGSKTACHVAVALREGLGSVPRFASNDRGQEWCVRAVFLSRIVPKKNLDGLLRALTLVRAPVELTIAGPVEDRLHWNTCERLMETLPENISVRLHGAVAPTAVVEFLSGFELFLLPTHGENYGHVILEALAVGLPVIVGSDTPWRQVEEEHAGWLVDSRSPTDLARLIERFARLTPSEKRTMSESAAHLARRVQEEGGGVDAHRRMFLELTQSRHTSTLLAASPETKTITQCRNRLRVKLVMRRPISGQFSVERVFRDIAGALPEDIEASLCEVPFLSRGLIPRLRNILFTARLREDVVHITGDIQYCALGVRPSRCVLTVLDLVSLRRLAGWRRHFFSVLWYRLPSRHAGAITTISTAVRDELLDHVPSVVHKVTVITCPVGNHFRPGPTETTGAGNFRVLQVGTGPNKNLERVAAALEGLPVHLHIIGRISAEQELGLSHKALSYSQDSDLSDGEMLSAYQQSSLLVFASTYEGFGLPILEAQACGVPVVTSAIPPMCSIAGDAAILVDPYDMASIRRGVKALLDNAGLRATLREAGLRNAARYSPERVAARYAETYRRVSSDRMRRRAEPRSWT